MAIETFLSYLSHEKRYSPHTIISYQNDLCQFRDYLYLTFETDLLEAKLCANQGVYGLFNG